MNNKHRFHKGTRWKATSTLGTERRLRRLRDPHGRSVLLAPDHVRTLASLSADGIVVGSAIVRKAAEEPSLRTVESFVRELASGVRP